MEFVEQGITEGRELEAYLTNALKPLSGVKLDCAVLGCTHYSFLAGAIQSALGGVRLFDGNEGTARQLRRVLADRGLLAERKTGSVRFFTSGDAERTLPIMRTLLEKPIEL